jgi:hypothetical protein
MCATPHERVYWNLRHQINTQSICAALLLDDLYERYGAELAFQAAFVIVWLERDLKDKVDVAGGGIHTFGFFQASRGNNDARTLLSDALECYYTDHTPLTIDKQRR